MAISEIKNNKFRLDVRVERENGTYGRFRKVTDLMQEALDTRVYCKRFNRAGNDRGIY